MWWRVSELKLGGDTQLVGYQAGTLVLAWTVSSSVWPPRSSGEHGPPLMDQTVVLCTLAAFILYYNTLQADFAYDDR